MKKAKVMLSAIAVFALIGGALAFKAQKFSSLPYFYCNTIANSCSPTVAVGITAITTNPLGATMLTALGTTAPILTEEGCAAQNCRNPLYKLGQE